MNWHCRGEARGVCCTAPYLPLHWRNRDHHAPASDCGDKHGVCSWMRSSTRPVISVPVFKIVDWRCGTGRPFMFMNILGLGALSTCAPDTVVSDIAKARTQLGGGAV